MLFDAHKNLAISTVATAPSPATSGTTMTLNTGEGARFPAVPFNATVWPQSTLPTPANAEIVRITAMSGDNITAMIRAQEGTTAQSIVAGYQIAATITAKTLTDIEGSYGTQNFRGLFLRTHPDADKATNQVAVVGLDELVMDSGFRYSGFTFPIAADVTASGAGGLDTGSRTASKWYEVWAIGKGTRVASDVALILHRAKEYALDLNQTTTGSAAPFRDASAEQRRCFKYTPGQSGPVEKITIHLAKVASPTGRVWLTIEADNAGKPSGTPLATSDKVDIAQISTSEQVIFFKFSAPYSVTSGTFVWIVMYGDNTIDGTNYLNVYYQAAGSFTFGIYNGTTWTISTGAAATFALQVWVTLSNGSLVYPTGYSECCKLGYVYNNSGNALCTFLSREKRVRVRPGQFTVITGFTTTVGVIMDLSTIVPPTPVEITVVEVINNTSGATMRITPPTEPGGNMGNVTTTDPSSIYHDVGCAVMAELQSMYLSISAGTGEVYLGEFVWQS